MWREVLNVEKEDMDMKVVNVEFVENEMVEMDVAQIGLNWGWSGDESDYESGYSGDERGDECGDGHAKISDITNLPPNPLYPPNNTPNNQSKPIVLTLSPISLTFSYLINFLLPH